jgi:hypothetical protein
MERLAGLLLLRRLLHRPSAGGVSQTLAPKGKWVFSPPLEYQRREN